MRAARASTAPAPTLLLLVDDTRNSTCLRLGGSGSLREALMTAVLTLEPVRGLERGEAPPTAAAPTAPVLPLALTMASSSLMAFMGAAKKR